MNSASLNRLHTLRMDNDAAKYRQEDMRGRFDRLKGRHDNGTAPRAVSAFNLFQTPASLAARLVDTLALAPGARVLEPSAGLGRILDALKAYQPAAVVAVEVAPACAGELFKQDRPGVQILQRDFLACTVAELGQFDAVAMNPPFHMRADVRHVQHALKFLLPGGQLSAILMNTPHREEALKARADSWEVLPDDTFKETGTRVSTILARFTA